MLYPQNGDRIVTIDSVTLLHPMYRRITQLSLLSCAGWEMSTNKVRMMLPGWGVKTGWHIPSSIPSSNPVSCITSLLTVYSILTNRPIANIDTSELIRFRFVLPVF